MNELKEKLIALGLGETMADQVILTVADYGKSKVPSSFHRTIDEVLAGAPLDMSKLMSSFFGGR